MQTACPTLSGYSYTNIHKIYTKHPSSRQSQTKHDIPEIQFGLHSQVGAGTRLGLAVTAAAISLLGGIGGGIVAFQKHQDTASSQTAVDEAKPKFEKLLKEQESLSASKKDIEQFLEKYSKSPFRYEITDTSDPARITALQKESQILDTIFLQIMAGRPDIQAALKKMGSNGIKVQLRDIPNLGKIEGSDSHVGGYQYCQTYSPSIELTAQNPQLRTTFVHEFTHLLDCLGIYDGELYFGTIDGYLPNLTPRQIQVFKQEKERLIRNIKNGSSQIDPHAVYLNPDPQKRLDYAEIVTETVELFFQASPILYTESPKLWKLYEEYFNVHIKASKLPPTPLETFSNDDADFIRSEIGKVMNRQDKPFTMGINPKSKGDDLINGDILVLSNAITTPSTYEWLHDINPKLAELLKNYKPPAQLEEIPKDQKTGLPIITILAKFNPETGIFDAQEIARQLQQLENLNKTNTRLNEIAQPTDDAKQNLSNANDRLSAAKQWKIYSIGSGFFLFVGIGLGIASARSFRKRYTTPATQQSSATTFSYNEDGWSATDSSNSAHRTDPFTTGTGNDRYNPWAPKDPDL